MSSRPTSASMLSMLPQPIQPIPGDSFNDRILLLLAAVATTDDMLTYREYQLVQEAAQAIFGERALHAELQAKLHYASGGRRNGSTKRRGRSSTISNGPSASPASNAARAGASASGSTSGKASANSTARQPTSCLPGRKSRAGSRPKQASSTPIWSVSPIRSTASRGRSTTWTCAKSCIFSARCCAASRSKSSSWANANAAKARSSTRSSDRSCPRCASPRRKPPPWWNSNTPTPRTTACGSSTPASSPGLRTISKTSRTTCCSPAKSNTSAKVCPTARSSPASCFRASPAGTTCPTTSALRGVSQDSWPASAWGCRWTRSGRASCSWTRPASMIPISFMIIFPMRKALRRTASSSSWTPAIRAPIPNCPCSASWPAADARSASSAC